MATHSLSSRRYTLGSPTRHCLGHRAASRSKTRPLRTAAAAQLESLSTSASKALGSMLGALVARGLAPWQSAALLAGAAAAAYVLLLAWRFAR